jgi:hypothetical protein
MGKCGRKTTDKAAFGGCTEKNVLVFKKKSRLTQGITKN